MKKILTFSLLIIIFKTSAQVSSLNMKLLLDKRILTEIVINNHENDTRPTGGCCLYTGLTTKMTLSKTFKLSTKSNEIVVEKELLRLITEEGQSGGELLYDSENLFDRSALISVGYSQFDKMVKKPLKYQFDEKGKRIDTLKKALTYEQTYINNIFNGQVFPHYLNYYWSEIFQFALPSKLEVGEIIKDHYLGTNSDLINDYTIISIKNNEVLLKIKGARLPKKISEEKRFDTKIFISGRSIYEGTILYDSNSLLIKELSLLHKKDNTNYSNNKEVSYTSTQDINIKNRIEEN